MHRVVPSTAAGFNIRTAYLVRGGLLSIGHAQGRWFSGNAGNNKDPDAAKQKQKDRERIKKDLGKLLLGGSLVDVRASAKLENSKVFQTTLLRPDEAPLLPDSLRSFKTIGGQEVSLPHATKPSALLLAFNQLGWSMLDDWMTDLPEKRMRIVRLSVVEGWGANFAKGFIERSLKASIPVAMHDKVALRTGSFSEEKRALDIDNLSIGYVFLIDSNARVGLRGCGSFTNTDRNQINQYLSSVL